MHRFRLFRVRSPLLTESMALSLPALTEMFHFGAYGSLACARVPGFSSRWVSPFGHLRIEARLAATRSISQLAASFFASRSLGIHHLLLVACPRILESQYGVLSQILSAGISMFSASTKTFRSLPDLPACHRARRPGRPSTDTGPHCAKIFDATSVAFALVSSYTSKAGTIEVIAIHLR
jgi:hypothetical protein